MPVGINRPSNQIKLTNVSVVRLKQAKKRFEIACYKNKVLEWRNGQEKDLESVLQIHNVFINVSKGQTAPATDLAKAFPKKSLDDVILMILNKGEIQVGEKERNAQLERIHNEVIGIVASKLVDPRTKRLYTTGMIEKALDTLTSKGRQEGSKSEGDNTVAALTGEAAKGKAKAEKDSSGVPTWNGVSTTRGAKIQALEAMKALIATQPIPIERARMRLKVVCPISYLGETTAKSKDFDGDVKKGILSFVEEQEHEETTTSDWLLWCFVEPGAYKGLVLFLGEVAKGEGKIEVLEMAVVHQDGEED